MSAKLTEASLRQAKIGAYFRPRDVARLGVSFHELRTLVAKGEVEKVADGLYRLVSFEGNELETVAMVGRAIPNGIVCLLTALRIHGIGTQSPHEVWIAIDRKAREPRAPGTKLRVVRFSGRMLTHGVQTQTMLGVPVKITSPARTVVDCFRYRNKFGLDVALEALSDAVRRRKATRDEIMRAAEVCRARTVLRKYLEAMSV
jgi:predicted transcriptional regulator of viral defense system